jgi:outer membrane receptor protein involved in Fe transport
MANLSKIWLNAALFLLLAVGVSPAQDQGSLRGTVKDPSGALISGATITLKATNSNVTLNSKTDANGVFLIQDIQFGPYSLRVESAGFAPLTQFLQVLPGITPTLELTMKLGATSTSVDVRASREEIATALSPGAVSVAYPDDTKGEFKSMPELLDQIPGVYVRRESGSGQYTTASIRGGAPTQVNIYVDGVPFNVASEVAADLSTLPVSNVERIEVYRGQVPSRFSGAPVGGAINIVTKKPTSFNLTTSVGARTLGGQQYSLALNGPLLKGNFLLGGDMERSRGNFNYTDFVDQQVQTLTLPADSYWGAVPYCQVFSASTPACTGLINKTRMNNDFRKDNLLTKWQTDRFSAKWSYLNMNRKMPYGLDIYPQVDDPSASPQYTVPRSQLLKQTEGVLGWNEHFGKLLTSLVGNIMDQDKQYYWQYPPAYQYGGSHWWYHTRRYGAATDLSYQLWDKGPIGQRFEFHGDWAQETLHTQLSNTDYNDYTGVGFRPSLRRHTVSFQLQDTITLRFLHNLEITPVGRMQRLTGPIIGNLLTPFAQTTGDLGWVPTGGVSVKQRFGRGWQAFVTYGRYVRYPNLYEIYGDGVRIIPRVNSDGSSYPLLPELGRTVDVGVGWDGDFSEKLSGHTRLTFFRRQTDNNITLFQGAMYSYYLNTGDTINRGIEFEGNLNYGKLVSLHTAATIQDGWYTDQGMLEWGFATPIFPASGSKIPTLNTPYGVGDARLDLHFLRKGALTTFFEGKYVGQNVVGIQPAHITLGNGDMQFRYEGAQMYERPLMTFDMGFHLKLPHGGTLSGGVTDLFNRGPNQQYGGYVSGGQYADGIHVIWYTCSTTGVKYPSSPAASVCPAANVITSNAQVPIKKNLFYPLQGRTAYVLLSWDLKSLYPRRK